MKFINIDYIVELEVIPQTKIDYYHYLEDKYNIFKHLIRQAGFYYVINKEYQLINDENCENDIILDYDRREAFIKPRVVINFTNNRRIVLSFNTLQEAVDYANSLIDKIDGLIPIKTNK
jgi:hypothetical protein